MPGGALRVPVGLFGKLPQKRDFVSSGIPRSILEPFEVWMQSAVAASRNQLGREWQDLYLVAPLWRFWIGAGIFGTGCAGVTMPSVDGIGRFFPLTLIGHGVGTPFDRPPTMAASDEWYRPLEEGLLGALGDEATGDAATILSGLASTAGASDPGTAEDRVGTTKRGRLWADKEPGAERLLAAVRDEDHALAAAQRSYWWTNGGKASGAAVYSCAGLPDPYFYSTMIGGAV